MRMWTPSLRKFIRLAKTTMDAVLLDTDVFSYLTRIGDTRGDAYRPHVRGKTVANCPRSSNKTNA